MNRYALKGLWTLAALAGLGTAAQAQLSVTNTQSASSSVRLNGSDVLNDSDSAVEGFASSQGIFPAGQSYQARTAARSRAIEIASNSLIADDGWSFQTFDMVLSQATYTIDVQVYPGVLQGSFDFFIPPSYLEVVSNAELPDNSLTALFFARIEVCIGSLGCDTRFDFQATLESSYRDVDFNYFAVGDGDIDTSGLVPTLTDTGTGPFIRTVNYAFPSFAGHLDLGIVPANQPLTVEYVLQTRASGMMAFNSAIAAINDPFLLDTDPVQGSPFAPTLTLAPVPEPSTALMLVAGLALIGRLRRPVRAMVRQSS